MARSSVRRPCDALPDLKLSTTRCVSNHVAALILSEVASPKARSMVSPAGSSNMIEIKAELSTITLNDPEELGMRCRHRTDNRKGNCGPMTATGASDPVVCPPQWPESVQYLPRSAAFDPSPHRAPCDRAPMPPVVQWSPQTRCSLSAGSQALQPIYKPHRCRSLALHPLRQDNPPLRQKQPPLPRPASPRSSRAPASAPGRYTQPAPSPKSPRAHPAG